MKPAKKKTPPASALLRFILIYALLLSLTALCFLNLSAAAAGFPPGAGYQFAKNDPRLIPFFWIGGGVCLLLLATVLLVNLRKGRRWGYSPGRWFLQWTGALGLTLLLMWGWDRIGALLIR